MKRAKGYLKKVGDLGYSADSRLVAYVSGSEQYLTWVRFNKNTIAESYCSCPYWTTCKHAVALVLVAAERVKLKQNIVLLAKGDELYDALLGNDESLDFETYSELDDDDGVEKSKGEVKFAALLSTKTKEELVTFLLDILPRYPDIAHELRDADRLKSAGVDKLITTLRRDIKKITAGPAWYDSWTHRGELPDYSRILKQLKVLLAKGQTDTLLQLGDELLQLDSNKLKNPTTTVKFLQI